MRRAALAMVVWSSVVAGQDVVTWHNDVARTGQNLRETALTPANVNTKSFGKLFRIAADGKVDAEPLYVHGLEMPNRGARDVLFVETEHDTASAFDANSGEAFWHVRLLGAGETPSDNRNCSQITPEIGITATPVIDRQQGPHGVLYVVAMSKDAQGQYHQRLHALDLQSGAERLGGPVEIRASDRDAPAFDPKLYAERAALLLVHGTLFLTWTSHCDIGRYNGWVMAYEARTLKQKAVLNLTPKGEEGAIWQSGAGPAADSEGNVYVMLGNGDFDTSLDASGFPARRDFGNSFVKIREGAGGLEVADYFTMFNVEAENDGDGDLGSGGPLVLPDMTDARGAIRHLVVGAGKDVNIYLLDRDAMGKFNAKRNNVYQEISRAFQHQYARPIPAYYNGMLYYATTEDPLRQYRFEKARLKPAPVSQSGMKFVYPGASPSISANGTRDGIVWVLENKDPAVLHAYDANDVSHELYSSNQAWFGRDHFGAGNKFITPMIANGKVYVGTTDGVGVFGLLKK
ncbi:MAG: pyrrolo-quinoline quinone [Acidobacteriaceae bacterium]|nr:pyrrolo-quinoline quinone [Acidobacteriaceae bacterium]